MAQLIIQKELAYSHPAYNPYNKGIYFYDINQLEISMLSQGKTAKQSL